MEPDPKAIVLPTACSTDTLAFSEKSVSEGSNGEQETVTGTTIKTPA